MKELPKYVIDLCVLTSFFRKDGYYNKNVMKTLWNKVEEMIESGLIVSHIEVMKEIEKGTDNLVLWAKSHKYMFYDYSEKQIEVVKNIGVDHPKFLEQKKIDFNADPWLVAQAKEYGLSIITREMTGADKIPSICGELGIPCLDMIRFLEKEKISI